MAAILRVKDENGNIVSIPAIKGDKGEKGDKGDRGLPGSGGVPDGGTTGQVLTKNSNADGDAGWKDNKSTVTESDISDALGYVPRKAWYVNITGSLGNFQSDKTPAEIYQAYTDGYIVYASMPASIVGFPFILPLLVAIPANDSYMLYFAGSGISSESPTVVTAIWNQTWQFSASDLVDDGNISSYLSSYLSSKLDKDQGTANSGKFLGIGADGIVVPTTVSGGNGEKEWRLLQTVEITEPVASFEIDKDSDGNPFSVNEIHILGSNITASAGTNPRFFYVNGQPDYEPTHQIINGSFTDSAKYWNFYAFSHGKLAVFTLTSQWNNGALQYVPVNREIPGSKISYFKLMVQFSGQTFNTGTFKIYGR